MIRIRNAMPNGCMYICWHNPNSNDYKYRMVYHGTSSTIETTTGVCLIWKHAGDSSVGGLYTNTASTDGIGWARTYLGASNGWAAFSKQDNRSSNVNFEGADKLVIPYYETPPELEIYWVASAYDDLLQTKVISNGTEYNSVGRYCIDWSGKWTRDDSVHTAFFNPDTNQYIAYNSANYTWIRFNASKQHTAIGMEAIGTIIETYNSFSQFPKTNDTYVNLGDLDTLKYMEISQAEVIHDTVEKTSTVNFGANRWGYVVGGGIPNTNTDYPDDGVDPIEEIEP